MSDEKINGRQEASANKEEISYSPSEGWRTTKFLEGPKASVIARINELAALGYSLNYSCDASPKASLSYSTVGKSGDDDKPETPTIQWELFSNRQEMDLLSPAAVLEGLYGKINLANISTKDQKLIRKWINEMPDDPNDLPSVDSGDAGYVYLLMLAGVRAYMIHAPTLRASKRVSGSYPVKASLSNVGRIYSTNTLSLVENIPNEILFNLPESSFKNADYGKMHHAWYKNYPNVQQAGGNRWSIDQTWDFGLWPEKLYGTVL